MRLILMRHGATAGNHARRYIGRTDEPLCPAGVDALRRMVDAECYPPVEWVYASPLRRCIDTREQIYPDVPWQTVASLREQDFGAYEGKTYEELCNQPDYRQWIETEGETTPPNGEARAAFWSRCRDGFQELCVDAQRQGRTSVAVVAHGGTLMALLSAYAQPRRSFYDWQVPNGCGWLVDWDGRALTIQGTIGFVDPLLATNEEEGPTCCSQ